MVDARVAGSSFPFHAQDHRLVDARRPQERAGARRARHGRCRAAAGRALRSRHAVHTPRLRRLRQAIRHPPLDGAIGDPRHNALAETFFASREKELLRRERFATREHARRRIFWYIECFYNTRRRHAGLDYLSPTEYEQRHQYETIEAEDPGVTRPGQPPVLTAASTIG
jgi:hypothetical protein